MDFDAGKIRFLDPNHLETASLGQAFPINFTNKWHQPLLQTGGLVEGIGKPTLIDSGYLVADGTLNPGQFAGVVRNGELITINGKPGWARLPNCVWNGETHSNLIIARADWNAIGLNFLARHLVTLNFPARTMYLKQIRAGPFIQNMEAADRFLIDLKENNQLPGWSKTDHGQMINPRAYSNPVTFTSKKNGDSSVYHYTVIRASKDSSWKLQKAWRTDQNDKVIEELPVP
ncbi:hypothetical protein [Pedosphaera parvula]|uniref:hypothetical protein n=1 Tax=Pedosphaera parvula TaxID=1032527 RepID=UPI0012374BA4|nr:hypothetical protein [Pedosphaera parvula]